ncbi:hypothetical protein ABZS95_43195 [Streptomyces sp. NPDC005479]|uniref:hypothetical protein n=1 Tax=unclassified Streptomyces TaxID=2593676 RepID=UPI0033A176C8
MPSMALYLREQEMNVRDFAKRLVITNETKKGPSPDTVMRMLRDHDDQAAAAASARSTGYFAVDA